MNLRRAAGGIPPPASSVSSSSSPTNRRQITPLRSTSGSSSHQRVARRTTTNSSPFIRCCSSIANNKSILLLLVGVLLGYIAVPVMLVEFDVDHVLGQLPEQPSFRLYDTHRSGSLYTTSQTPNLRVVNGDSQPAPPRNLDVSVASDKTASLTDAEKRLMEDRNVLASQSLPTPTTPYIMKTPRLPDHQRLKVLVTGGAGFVGSHLVDKLMMEGHEVVVVDNFFTGQKKNIAHWLHHPNFSLITHDVTEPIMLEVDQIYHLACPASPPHYQYNPVKTIKTSTMGTLNMLGLAKRVKARMLLTSTSEIYGDPKEHPQKESYWGNVNTIGPRSCYDEGKRVAETMMYSYRNQNEVSVRVARIFNTFGPRMHPNDGRVVSNFIIQALQNKDMTIYGTGTQTRSFQYVSDLVDGLHALMNGDYDLPVNLGNPSEYTIKDFATYIKTMTSTSSEIKLLPASEDDPSQRRPDISTAKAKINWEPKVKVVDGLKKTIAYFKSVLEEAGEIIPTGPGAAKPEA
ncbi:UDP-glucuronic acid decarboxylase 1 [Mayamaea pseudoterrestris]|nr:UDP-glucuronic acid decarboxylase 1 [Mayamaea pseudoterrestris]